MPSRSVRAALAALLACTLALPACSPEPQQTAEVGPAPTPSAARPSPEPTIPAPTPEPEQPWRPSVDIAQLRASAPDAPSPWPWGTTPSPDRGHRVCADAGPPPRATHATFARIDGSASLTPDVISAICAAAPKATVKIAMYFIENNGPDVQRILDALSFIAKRRAVKVRIVEDKRRRDESSDFTFTAEQLRTFAAVHNCLDGCRSVLAPRGEAGGSPQVEVQHHKFMVISDTYDSRGVTPVVWLASANWSDKQLHGRSQSGLVVRDRGLADVFGMRFDSLDACATRGCGVWNRMLRRRGLPVDTYGVVQQGGIWFDRTEALWSGTPGRGSAVQFSPWLRGDPVAAQLRAIRCTPEHSTVWMAQRAVARSRTAVTAALAALDDRGCDVRIAISSNSLRAVITFADGYSRLRELGLDVTCVEGVHDKFLLINAVDAVGGEVVRTISAGSQGMLRRALHFSDEALVTLSTTAATGQARKANKATWKDYKDHFKALAAQPGECPF